MLNNLKIDGFHGVKVAIFQNDTEHLSALRSALHADPRMTLLRAENSFRSASNWLDCSQTDVLITDTSFADGCGIELIRDCAERCPQCSILVLSDSCDESTVFRSLGAGASGYILKRGSPENLANVVLELHDGGSALSPEIVRMMVKRLHTPGPGTFANRSPSASMACHPATLTKREIVVLAMIEEGHSDKSIADGLVISRLTVQTHTKNIYRKLGVHSRTEALHMMRLQGCLVS